MKQIARRASVTALIAVAALLPLTGAAQAATTQAPAQSAASHPCGDDWECWHHWHHGGLGLGLGLGLGVGVVG
ncbi:hypothetical protein ACIBL6_47240 [Streptomyces sp. NPDC050400]|uniref:hypothetical protein n=1 Tax=Streptomyces sp. NPDC050400 TaxID=3365610 RepID=UPI00379B9535